jgi:hypothetical protein
MYKIVNLNMCKQKTKTYVDFELDSNVHFHDENRYLVSIFIRDKPIFSSERMLHKDYYRS